MDETSSRNSTDRDEADGAGSAVHEQADYCGVLLEDWKKALGEDVAERFGPIPDDLKPAGESGW